MKINAPVPWFGGKRTLAPRIAAELGPHRCYFEPFCGSMAVLFAKEPCGMETVNDLHGDLTNLARVLQHAGQGPWLFERALSTLPAEELFNAAYDRLQEPWDPDGMNPGRALAFFTFCWLGRNGIAGCKGIGKTFARRFTQGGGHGGVRFASAVESIPEWHHRLRPVMILRQCGLEMVESIEDAQGNAVYCDPPYLVKGASYVHDFEAADHVRLAVALGKFRKTRVVVSYYDHPRLAELYPGWTKVLCPVAKAMVQQGKRGKEGRTEAPEVLLLNGPSLTATGPAGGLFQ